MVGNCEIECCGKILEFMSQNGEGWQAYVPEIATCDVCGTYLEKKPENEHAYKLIKNDGDKEH